MDHIKISEGQRNLDGIVIVRDKLYDGYRVLVLYEESTDYIPAIAMAEWNHDKQQFVEIPNTLLTFPRGFDTNYFLSIMALGLST